MIVPQRVAVLCGDPDDPVARSVADQLAAAGADARLSVGVPGVDELGGVNAAVLAVPPPMVPAALEAGTTAGAGRVVLLSSASAPWERTSPPEDQWFLPAEKATEACGLDWTIVRPAGYMGAALAWAADVRADGVVRHPHAAAAYPHVHEADVAAVAAVAALGPGHHGARYMVTGPESITPPEQAEALAAALGRPITFEELSPAEAAERWRAAGWPEDAIELELMLLAEFVDRAPRPRDTVQKVVGRPAPSFMRWAAEHADDFR
jgi:uncharacterized protein YbjT (DUF2867 family)